MVLRLAIIYLCTVIHSSCIHAYVWMSHGKSFDQILENKSLSGTKLIEQDIGRFRDRKRGETVTQMQDESGDTEQEKLSRKEESQKGKKWTGRRRIKAEYTRKQKVDGSWIATGGKDRWWWRGGQSSPSSLIFLKGINTCSPDTLCHCIDSAWFHRDFLWRWRTRCVCVCLYL